MHSSRWTGQFWEWCIFSQVGPTVNSTFSKICHYFLQGGHFNVAPESCTQKPYCGTNREDKKQWILYNTFSNRVLNPGDHLHITFIAEVWKKFDLGLAADIDFYGFDQVFRTEYRPMESVEKSDESA